MDPTPLAPPYIPPPFAPPPPSAAPPPPPAAAAAAAAAAEVPAASAAPSAASGEAQNHSSHVAANPTPAVAPAHSHPPYSEMIYAAIGALKERDGSSKRAIAKFIEKTYADLPPTHSALLTHHLKRLKNSGHLVMVKKSYKLPGSGDAATAPNLPAAPEGSESKRRRGRPPKAKLEGLLAATPAAAPAGAAEPVLVSQGPDGGPAPIPVPLPGDTPAKRGRGRPPKSGVVKSRVGRPLKPSLVAVLANGEQNGPKPRGRPRKNVGGGASVASTGEALSVFGKRRGRPPGSGRGKRPMVASQPRRSTGRPMGRPRKNAALGASLAAGSNDDFRRTLEYIQLKIKEAVGVLRPHLTSSISAVDAIQELEAITTMDFAAVPVVGSSSVAPS